MCVVCQNLVQFGVSVYNDIMKITQNWDEVTTV